jgi:hypothetical protein
MDKHSSLFNCGVSDEEKKFYDIDVKMDQISMLHSGADPINKFRSQLLGHFKAKNKFFHYLNDTAYKN